MVERYRVRECGSSVHGVTSASSVSRLPIHWRFDMGVILGGVLSRFWVVLGICDTPMVAFVFKGLSIST